MKVNWSRSALVMVTLLVATAAHCQCNVLPDIDQILAKEGSVRNQGLSISDTELFNLALYSYRNIADEAIDRHGIYLDAIATTVAPGCKADTDVSSWLRQLLQASDSAVTFSRRLAIARMIEHDQSRLQVR